jgi:tyrosine-protein kinase Etk/Wzc
MENKEINKTEKEFDSMIIISEIFKWKWFIIGFTILIGIASTFYAYNLPNWYSSTLSMVPPKSSGSMLEGALGNISSALKEFGMTKLGGKSGESYSYLVVLNSRSVKDSIIRKYNIQNSYEMQNERFSAVREAFESNLEINLETEGNYTITILDKDANRAVEMVTDYYNLSNDMAKSIFRTESRVNREYMESRLKTTEDALNDISSKLEKYSADKSIISPIEQAKAVSQAISELKADQIKQDIILHLLKNKYGENDPYTQMQKTALDELNKKVTDIETKPGFAGNFPLTKATEVGINYMKLYAQYETFTKVKAFLLPMLEDAKLNEQRETYSLFVLDKPIPADKKAKPKRSVIIAGATIGGFAFAVLVVILIYNLRIFRRKIKTFQKAN